MRFLQADYLFPGDTAPIAGAVVAVADDGTVTGISDTGEAPDGTESYSGILCPGFVNAHCHIELSGMKGMIAEGGGLAGFIGDFIGKRSDDVTPVQAMAAADREMAANGIVAVGDIANTALSAPVKAASALHYHTFVEVFGMADAAADGIVARGREVLSRFPGGQSSLTPHAPYSVSDSLFASIVRHAVTGMPLSIHNQESASENELFESGTGALADYFRAAGMAMPDRAAGCTSLHYMLERLPAGIPLLLVHNTFTRCGDLEEVSRSGRVVTWCFCPNANLYIERALPDFVMFHRAGARCCLGTDSYASNHQLSVLEEMKAVTRSAPSVPLKDLIDWATVNGARALGIDGWAGRIAAGFRPGINLIRDAGAERLSGDSSVQKLA